MDLEFKDKSHLKLSHLKFRLGILPLLKGNLSVNYFNVEKGECRFEPKAVPLLSMEEEKFFVPDLEDLKSSLKQRLPGVRLPFSISLHRFAIEEFTLLDQGTTSFPLIGISGTIKAQKDLRDFFFEANVFSPIENTTYLEIYLQGNQKLDFIDAKFRVDACGANAQLSLQGPWSTWEGILNDVPFTKGPLVVKGKGKLTAFAFKAYPLLNRDWKFKTQCSVLCSKEIEIQNLFLSSDLIGVKARGHLYEELSLSKAVLAFSLPDLSLFDYPGHIHGSAKGKMVLQKGEFKGSMQTQKLEVENFAIGTILCHLKGQTEKDAWQAEVKLSSSTASTPFDSSFALGLKPDSRLYITDLKLETLTAKLEGSLDYSIADRQFEGSVIASVEDIEPFNAYFKDKFLAGRIDAELQLTREDKKQQASCALIGKNMRYRQVLIDDLSMSAVIGDLFENPDGPF